MRLNRDRDSLANCLGVSTGLSPAPLLLSPRLLHRGSCHCPRGVSLDQLVVLDAVLSVLWSVPLRHI